MTTPKERGRPRHPDILTPAEWRVAELVRHGLTNRAIAALMGVSADAVKFHVASILSKLGYSRRAEVRRWDGVRAGSALLAATGAPGDAGFGAIGQVGSAVADLARAEAWYRDVLGLRHLFSAPSMAFFDCGGTRLCLREGAGDASILYFRVADIRAEQARLEAAGVTFLAAPHLIHRHDDGMEEWMAFFADDEGRPLALMAQLAPPASAVGDDEEDDR